LKSDARHVRAAGRACVILFARRISAAILGFLACTALSAGLLAPRTQAAPTAPAAGAGDQCLVIDTDYDIDDMMSIPLLLANTRVAAIVTTEGYTLAPLGASALARLIAEPNSATHVPVVIGAAYPGKRDTSKWPWLADLRKWMDRSNGLLSVPLPPRPDSNDYTKDLVKAVESCSSVKVLIIGPFTSFVRYGPALKNKISQVVMSGQPRTHKLSFNCAYDEAACEAAFKDVKDLNGVRVEVPKKAKPPYSPTIEMVEGLKPYGLPGALRQALLSNQKNWRIDLLEGGNKSFLWDQLAALYLLHPELYHPEGAHLEPTVPPAEIQRLWTLYTNRAAEPVGQ